MTKHLLLILVLFTVACGGPEFQSDTFTDFGEAGAPVGAAAGSSSAAGASSGSGGSTATAGAGSTAGDSSGGSVVMAGAGGEPSAGSGGSSAGAGGAPSECVAPYLAELTAAASFALPETFTWQDFYTDYFDGACYRQTVCRDEPCGTCSVTWGEPQALADGSKVIVDFTSACVDIPTTLVCGSDSFSCVMKLTGSGSVTIDVQPATRSADTLSWTLTQVDVSAVWEDHGQCSYTHEEAASDDLNAELGMSLNTLSLATTCQ